MSQDRSVGHRERLRKRFLQAGADAFADHELLELILTYSIPRRDVKSIAKALLERCGDLAGVFGAPRDLLESVPGMGSESAALIRLMADMAAEIWKPERRRHRKRISTLDDAIKAVRALVGAKREEEFYVILLDAKNQVLGEERLVQGTVDRVAVFPRKVLELALSRRAAAILIAHNHPSGDPTPSRQDRELTSAMKEAARAVEVRFLDHIIMAGNETYSFHQSAG